jgi:hypothetical protein
MPELLGLLLLSVVANLVGVYLWFQQVHLLRSDEGMIRYLNTQIIKRNQLITRLIHEADKTYCEDQALIKEAEAVIGLETDEEV